MAIDVFVVSKDMHAAIKRSVRVIPADQPFDAFNGIPFEVCESAAMAKARARILRQQGRKAVFVTDETMEASDDRH